MISKAALQLLLLAKQANIPVSTSEATEEHKIDMQDIITTATHLRASDNIAACSSVTKQTIIPSAKAAYRINLNYLSDGLIKSLRIIQFQGFNSESRLLMMQAPLNYYVSITTGDNEKLKFTIKDEAKLTPSHLVTYLIENCPTQFIEVVIPKRLRCQSSPLSSEKWATMYRHNSAVTRYYSEVNDPLLLKSVSKALRFQPEVPVILDVGGGRGRVAKQVLQLPTIQATGCHYILLEPSSSEIRVARKALRQLVEESKSSIQITYINDIASTEVLDGFQEKVNLIISSGGPLNEQIVELGEAKTIANDLSACLAENGILISSGLTYNLLNRKDLESLGLRVSNTTVRETSQALFTFDKGMVKQFTQEPKTELLQLYVARKPKQNLLQEGLQVLAESLPEELPTLKLF